MTAPVARAPNAISSRPRWPGLFIRRPPCRALGQAREAWPGWEPTEQSAYEQAIANHPGVWQTSACRLWSASRGRLESEWVACTRGAQSTLSSAEV